MNEYSNYPTATDTIANATGDNGWFSIGALGVTATLDGTTIGDLFTQALPWDVTEDAAINGATLDVVPDLKLIRRGDNDQVIGWGKQSFTPVLNSEAREVLETGLAGVGHSAAAAGSLRGGALTFVAVKLDDAGAINVDGDIIEPYLLLANSFDGSSTLRLLSIGVRPACSNVLNIQLRQTDATLVTIRHTRNAKLRLTEVRQAIKRFTIVRDNFQADVARLINTDVTDRQAAEVLATLTPIPSASEDPSASKVTRAERRREELVGCYRNDTRVGFTGTAYGLLQAWSTYTQNDAGFRLTAVGPRDRGERKVERAIAGGTAEHAAFKVIDRLVLNPV